MPVVVIVQESGSVQDDVIVLVQDMVGAGAFGKIGILSGFNCWLVGSPSPRTDEKGEEGKFGEEKSRGSQLRNSYS